MKKKHPCGGDLFRILRVGSDMRIICETCGRDMTVDRIRLEKNIKTIFPVQNDPEKNQKGKSGQA